MNKIDKDNLTWYIKELLQFEKDIVVFTTDGIIHLEVKGHPFYLYMKSLTYAGNPYPRNTTRAQLPRRDEFDSIKKSNAIFLFLGYDEVNEVFACWDPVITKKRLNEKQYVSFFSRLNLQESVKSGEFINATLQNDFRYILFKINDLPLFLTNIAVYFPEITEETVNVFIPPPQQGRLLDVKDDSSVKLFIDEQYSKNIDIPIISLVSDCINEFGDFYQEMTLKDWFNIVRNYHKPIPYNTEEEGQLPMAAESSD